MKAIPLPLFNRSIIALRHLLREIDAGMVSAVTYAYAKDVLRGAGDREAAMEQEA